jgi:4-amino-4-deoxy-L-arabinose transferase-like glycosyltransferase
MTSNSKIRVFLIFLIILDLILFFVGLSFIAISYISYENWRYYIMNNFVVNINKFNLSYFNSLMINIRVIGYIFLTIFFIYSYFINKINNKLILQYLSSNLYMIKFDKDKIYHYLKDNIYHLFILLIIIMSGVILRLYYINQPIRYDEAFNYLIYAKNNFIYIISYYNLPNNHIFHTILMKISCNIFGDTIWSIRMPAFIAGVFLIPVTYISASLFFNKKAGLVSSCLVSTSSILIEYSTNGRGYTIICLITMTMIIAFYYALKNRNIFWWILLSILTGIGFYTIPIMLYPFIMVYGWALINIIFYYKNRAILIKYVVTILSSILFTIILYTPVILISGMKKLIRNEFVMPQKISLFIMAIPKMIIDIYLMWNRDLSIIVMIILLLGFIYSIIYFNNISNIKVSIINLGILLISPLILLQRVIPPSRVWLFLLPVYLSYSSAGIVFIMDKTIKSKYYNNIFYFLLILLLLVNSINVIKNKSIYVSQETGTFPEAEEVTYYLKNKLTPEVRIVVLEPSDFPLKYYFSKQNIDASYFINSNTKEPLDEILDKEIQENSIKRIVIIENDEWQQYDLQYIKNKYRINEKIELLKKFKKSKLYITQLSHN